MNLAKRIREKSIVPFTVTLEGEELTFQLLRPQPMHLVAAGMPVAAFSHARPVRRRLQDQEAYFRELAQHEEKTREFMNGLFRQCLVEPRFHAGALEECPEDHVTLDLIEPVAAALFNRLLELAGYEEAQAAAKAAEAFREDAGGAAGEPGGAVLRDPAVGNAAGLSH